MMRKLCVLIVQMGALCGTGNLAAQDPTGEVVVRFVQDGEPLREAVVAIEGPRADGTVVPIASAPLDGEGMARLSVLSPNRGRLRVVLQGATVPIDLRIVVGIPRRFAEWDLGTIEVPRAAVRRTLDPKGTTPPAVPRPTVAPSEPTHPGGIAGRLADATDLAHCDASILVQRLEGGAEPLRIRSVMTDARGRFYIDDLAPGRYALALERGDARWIVGPGRRVIERRPVVGFGADPRSRIEVQVDDGEVTGIELPAAPLGRITGRVTQRGLAVPGAVVFQVARASMGSGIDAVDFERGYLATTTDAAGEFAFYCAETGVHRFRARMPTSPTAGAERRVRVRTLGVDVELGLAIGGAELRGGFDPGGFDHSGAEPFELFLFRGEDAARDPFFFPDLSVPFIERLTPIAVDAKGRFVAPDLDAGEWLLRVVGDRKRVLLQRRVLLVDDAELDLGELRAQALFDVVVACAHPLEWRVRGAWLREPGEGDAPPAFERVVPLAGDGSLQLGAIRAGRYAVELFDRTHVAGTIGLSGRSFGVVRELVIGADGSVDPAGLDFR